MKSFKLWAKLLVLKNRSMPYFSILQLLMLTQVFSETFTQKSLGWFLLILGIIGLVSITLIDYYYVMNHENSINTNKNEALLEKFRIIEEKIDNLKK